MNATWIFNRAKGEMSVTITGVNPEDDPMVVMYAVSQKVLLARGYNQTQLDLWSSRVNVDSKSIQEQKGGAEA